MFCLDPDFDPVEILSTMRSFIINFFGCTECAENFKKETHDLTEENTAELIKNNDDAILYLWRVHNSVNKRLHGDVTEDPLHPKVQFPTADMCVECWSDAKSWNRSNVLLFLKRIYSIQNIAKDSEILRKSNAVNVKDAEHRREMDSERNQNFGERGANANPVFYALPSDSNYPSFNKRKIGVIDTSSYIGLNGFDMCLSVLCYCTCCFLILIIYLKIVVRYRCKR